MKVRKRISMKFIINKILFEYCGENSRFLFFGYYFCFWVEFYLM